MNGHISWLPSHCVSPGPKTVFFWAPMFKWVSALSHTFICKPANLNRGRSRPLLAFGSLKQSLTYITFVWLPVQYVNIVYLRYFLRGQSQSWNVDWCRKCFGLKKISFLFFSFSGPGHGWFGWHDPTSRETQRLPVWSADSHRWV